MKYPHNSNWNWTPCYPFCCNVYSEDSGQIVGHETHCTHWTSQCSWTAISTSTCSPINTSFHSSNMLDIILNVSNINLSSLQLSSLILNMFWTISIMYFNWAFTKSSNSHSLNPQNFFEHCLLCCLTAFLQWKSQCHSCINMQLAMWTVNSSYIVSGYFWTIQNNSGEFCITKTNLWRHSMHEKDNFSALLMNK